MQEGSADGRLIVAGEGESELPVQAASAHCTGGVERSEPEEGEGGGMERSRAERRGAAGVLSASPLPPWHAAQPGSAADAPGSASGAGGWGGGEGGDSASATVSGSGTRRQCHGRANFPRDIALGQRREQLIMDFLLVSAALQCSGYDAGSCTDNVWSACVLQVGS